MSKAGYDKSMAEYTQLKTVDHPAILVAVKAARDLGDLSENAEYSSAKETERNINKRMRYLEEIIENAEIIDVASLSGDRVTFGAHVVVEDEDGRQMQCQLLSDIEADGRSIVACTSPFGRAMIGKCVGDTCVVKTPSGDREYEILEISFKK